MKKIIVLTVALLFSNYLLSQVELWGFGFSKNNDDIGIIYKINSLVDNKNIGYKFSFYNNCWSPNGDLFMASNGKFYGMTSEGGKYEKGVIFEYSPMSDSVINKIDFDGINNGASPMGSLIQATNGKMYGMTNYGGTSYLGVIFEFDPITESITKKVDFDGINKGANPRGSLIQASNGKLYGMTYYGGANNKGVLFEFDLLTNTFIKKVDFGGTNNGGNPNGSLMQASNGKLYGMTFWGGSNGDGVIFEYDPVTNTFVKKIDFDINIGRHPFGSLMQATNGKLYGMTFIGGAKYQGTLFEYNPVTNNSIVKVNFDGINKGANPYGSLMQASNGELYGMTATGGQKGNGILFKYDIVNDSLITKVDFEKTNKGNNPQGSLIQASNGKLYGMTREGGISNRGILFEYNPVNDLFIKKVDFFNLKNGAGPKGTILQATNGKLYGVTTYGGENIPSWGIGCGVLFEYDLVTNTFTKKADFDRVTTGELPQGSLIQASNGKLYGLAYGGGINNNGVLYEYDITADTLIKKVDFDGAAKGAFPWGSLMQANNGKLYGMTGGGGINYQGVLFEYDPNMNSFSKKVDFDKYYTGEKPFGALIQAINGKLYGMTRDGGIHAEGVLFEYDPVTNIFTKKVDFNGNIGSFPIGSLTQVSNGKMYGMTTTNGKYGKGTLFEYDPVTNIISIKVSFGKTINESNNGKNPNGSLVLASNGKLYGTTGLGGAFGSGVFFEYDPVSDTFVKKIDLNEIKADYYGHLIELSGPVSTPYLTHSVGFKLKILPNPNKGEFVLQIDAIINKNHISTVELYDILGSLIHSEQVQFTTNLRKKMEFNSLKSGVYFIRIITDDNILFERFIIQ